MAGSYDTEDSQNERYRLSFTVGGLLAEQGRIIAALFSGDRGEHVNPDSDPVNRTTEVEHEIRPSKRTCSPSAPARRTPALSARY